MIMVLFNQSIMAKVGIWCWWTHMIGLLLFLTFWWNHVYYIVDKLWIFKVLTTHKIVWNASLMSRLMIEMRQFLFRKGLYIYLTFLHSFYCFTFLKPKGMDSFILERNLFYSITFFTRLFASIRKTYPQIAFTLSLDGWFIEVKQKLVVLTRKVFKCWMQKR